MKHSAEIFNELKEVSPFLSEVEKTNVYSVPENYFLNLDIQIVQRIKNAPGSKEEKMHFDFNMPASEPQLSDVPEGYFDSLPENILKKIKNLETDNASEELKQLSPMLYSIQNENVFSVPRGYFGSFPENIMIAIKPQAKIVSIKKRSNVWEYASAAILAGVMAVSALWVSNNNSSQQSGLTAKVTTVPAYIKEARQYKNQQQVSEGISNLADDDIINYLEATGSNADDETLANIVQEKQLPSEEDYLLNEHALENFLGKTDLKSNEN
jgi:hypothetical protein